VNDNSRAAEIFLVPLVVLVVFVVILSIRISVLYSVPFWSSFVVMSLLMISFSLPFLIGGWIILVVQLDYDKTRRSNGALYTFAILVTVPMLLVVVSGYLVYLPLSNVITFFFVFLGSAAFISEMVFYPFSEDKCPYCSEWRVSKVVLEEMSEDEKQKYKAEEINKINEEYNALFSDPWVSKYAADYLKSERDELLRQIEEKYAMTVLVNRRYCKYCHKLLSSSPPKFVRTRG